MKRDSSPIALRSQHLTHFCWCGYICAFVICVWSNSSAWTVHILAFACKNRLTDDEGGYLVPAGALLILDFTDESGVDSIVHLLHHQLVFLHRNCFRQ